MSLDRDRAQVLMMAALDDETTVAEQRELDELLRGSEELRAEWERFARVKEVTRRVKLRTPPDEIWEEYMSSVFLRVERSVGWILTSVGAVILISYGLWTGVRGLIGSSEVPLYLKGAILSLLTGLVVLLVSVAREKFFMSRTDPYSRVER